MALASAVIALNTFLPWKTRRESAARYASYHDTHGSDSRSEKKLIILNVLNRIGRNAAP